MQENTEFLSKSNMKKILLLCFLVILMAVAFSNIGAIFIVIKKMLDLIFPFILGACIAFVFNVPMKKIETTLFKKKPGFKGKRAISYILAFVLVFGIIVLAMFVIVPELIETLKNLAAEVPAAIDEAQKYLVTITKRFPEISSKISDIKIDDKELVNKLVSLFSGASGVLSSTIDVVTNVVNGFATFFIAFAFSIYVLFRKEELARQVKKVLFALLPERFVNKFLDVCVLSNKTFSNFITGQCLEACILGLMFFITLSIMGMPYALLISVLITLTALIPIFGAFIGCAIGALLILFVSMKQAIIFVIVFLILQQIEGNLIYPHVVGGSVGLPSIWVLVAITVGGDLMGIAGMIIFIPLCSVAYSLFRDFINEKAKKKGVAPEKYEKPYIDPPEEKHVKKVKTKEKVVEKK